MNRRARQRRRRGQQDRSGGGHAATEARSDPGRIVRHSVLTGGSAEVKQSEPGIEVREGLRDGVQRAIEYLGQGSLAHPSNAVLLEDLRSGALDKQDYYRQILRLVYRLLFLFVADDRDLLLTPTADPAAQNATATSTPPPVCAT